METETVLSAEDRRRFLHLYKRYRRSFIRGVRQGHLFFNKRQIREVSVMMAEFHMETDAKEKEKPTAEEQFNVWREDLGKAPTLLYSAEIMPHTDEQ